MLRAALAALLCAASGAALACNSETSDYPTSVTEADVIRAWYDGATDRYPHFVLGRLSEPSALVVEQGGDCLRLDLGPNYVFEDVAPRLVDLDLDGRPEVITVRSGLTLGAQIAVYRIGETLTLDAATPHIGQRNRWFAPVGAADLDGDGRVEIAFVDRPHLARTLRVWRYEDGALAEVAAVTGVTNHRIGEPFISGGLRECGAGPEIILASADWQRAVGVKLQGGSLTATDLGPWSGAERLLDCG